MQAFDELLGLDHNVTGEMFRPDGFWGAYKWFLDNYQHPNGVVPRGGSFRITTDTLCQ